MRIAVFNYFLIIIFGVLPAQAQKNNVVSIPRDTSFTLYQTYVKERKRFPEIRMVLPELPDGVAAHEGLVYSILPETPYGNRELHVNLYRPDDQETYPALIMVHGGGWHSGDLSLQVPMAQQIASQGYVTVPVEYRLSPEALYPAGVHDVKAAIRWVRANAAQYGIDPERIAISGCSAGGHLANLVGMTNGVTLFEGAGGNPQVSSAVHAIIDIDGVADFLVESRISRARNARTRNQELPSDAKWFGGAFEEIPGIWQEASPIRWVTSKAPPVCYISSNERIHEGRDMQIVMLNKLNIYSELHVMETSIHPFWLLHPWFHTTVNYMVNFLDKTFKP